MNDELVVELAVEFVGTSDSHVNGHKMVADFIQALENWTNDRFDDADAIQIGRLEVGRTDVAVGLKPKEREQ